MPAHALFYGSNCLSRGSLAPRPDLTVSSVGDSGVSRSSYMVTGTRPPGGWEESKKSRAARLAFFASLVDGRAVGKTTATASELHSEISGAPEIFWQAAVVAGIFPWC